MTETPDAQKRGSVSVPGICVRNSGANSPKTAEIWTPTFSNTRPCIIDITPPPPGAPLWSVRFQGVRVNTPGGRNDSCSPGGRSFSSCSRALQISSRRLSNHCETRLFLSSICSAATYVDPRHPKAEPCDLDPAYLLS